MFTKNKGHFQNNGNEMFTKKFFYFKIFSVRKQ